MSTVATKQNNEENAYQLERLAPATVWVVEILSLGQNRKTMQASDEQEDHGNQLDERVFKAWSKVSGAVWVKRSL